MPDIWTPNPSRTPRNNLNRLTLPQFETSSYDGRDLSDESKSGRASSHPTSSEVSSINYDQQSSSLSDLPYDVKCAIIYCESAMMQGRRRRFEPYRISNFEAVFHAGDQPCSIPLMIDLPVWMRYIGDQFPEYHRENTVATWLNVIADLNDEGFGFARKQWLDNVLVARADGKDLLPQHLEVLSYFCRHVFYEVVGENLGLVGLSEDPGIRKIQQVTFRKLVSRKSFMEYYETYCSERAAMDEQWRRLPSPYYDLPSPISDDMHHTHAEPSTDGNRQVNGHRHINGNAEEIDEEDRMPPGPRRSHRPTRPPARVLDDLPLSAVDDERKGRSRRRRSSDSDYA